MHGSTLAAPCCGTIATVNSSPPITHNFDATPVVTIGPYSYDPEDGSYTTQDGVRHA